MAVKRIPAGTGFERLTEAVTTEFGQLIELVRQAVREKLRGTPGMSDYYVDMRGIFADRVVVCLAGRLYSYPYTLSAENAVTLGAQSEVVMAFTAVRESTQEGAPVTTFTEAADGSIEVTLIRAGTSINGNFYSDAVLREAAPMFEGVRVFAKSDAEHTKGAGKDVRNLLGGIYSVRFVEGASPDGGALVGTFKPIDQIGRASCRERVS
jgi:hypothetical protein